MKKVYLVSILILLVVLASSCAIIEDYNLDSTYEFILDGKTYDMVFYDLNETQYQSIITYNGNKVLQILKYYITNEEYGIKITKNDDDYMLYIKFNGISNDEIKDNYNRFMTFYVDGYNAILPLFSDNELQYSISTSFANEIGIDLN